MPQALRKRRTQHFEDWFPLHSQISWISARFWSVSEALGAVGLVILVCALFLLVLTGRLPVGRVVMWIVPDRLVEFVADKLTVPDEPDPANRRNTLERIGSALGAKEPQGSGRAGQRSQSFAVGSTKDEVRRIQGTPSKATDSVWYYGRSEVYFVGDRVVGWSAAPGDPLKVR